MRAAALTNGARRAAASYIAKALRPRDLFIERRFSKTASMRQQRQQLVTPRASCSLYRALLVDGTRRIHVDRYDDVTGGTINTCRVSSSIFSRARFKRSCVRRSYVSRSFLRLVVERPPLAEERAKIIRNALHDACIKRAIYE